MSITVTELQICTCWHFTRTEEGCIAFVATMAELQRECFFSGDLRNAELINQACDLAIAKGEYLKNFPTVH